MSEKFQVPIRYRIARYIPFFGKLLTRYHRALIVINDEFSDSKSEAIERLSCDEYWKARRSEIGGIESWEGDQGKVAWKQYPFA